MNEIASKLLRVRNFLSKQKAKAVLLTTQPNFAWITGGKEGRVSIASEAASAQVLITSKKAYICTKNIETERMFGEDLLGRQFESLNFPWQQPEQAALLIKKTVGKGRIVGDSSMFGAENTASGIARLRWQLLPEEIKHYREVGLIASKTLETVAKKIKPGMTEFEIAGRLSAEIMSAGAIPHLILVATDERINRYRHPLPVAKKLKRHAMLIVCARKYGLIASATRLVYFGKLPSDLRKKHEAVCMVDCALNLSTRPGAVASDILKAGIEAYEDYGFKNEWKLHHQGGATGYVGRDWTGLPTLSEVVLENQAFAWNPSITGTKSEDTIIVTKNGIEIITPASSKWPMIHIHGEDGCIERPAILVR